MFANDGHLRISSAAMGKFDIREDEEQYAKQANCIELLNSAGYHRAKIQGLSAFDKIVGGMVWCISLCAHSVDVDLLYSENSTIGQKIALTERIVKVLPKLPGCPGSLEPHQIQGLDCIHILPVLQWLVKEASFVREKRGDEQENHSVYQFAKKGWRIENDTDEGVRPMVKSKRKVYRRVIRMKDVRRHGDPATAKESAEAEHTEEQDNLVVCGDNGYYAETGGDEAQPAEIRPQMSEMEANEQIEMLNKRLAEMDTEIASEEERLSSLTTSADEIKAKIAFHDDLIARTDPAQIEALKSLLAERDEIKSRELAFKRKCRRQLEELDVQIQQLEESNLLEESESHEESTGFSKEKEALIEKVRLATKELRRLEKEIFVMERRLESQPSQVELNQYQKRFVELYNQMSSKHVELKKQYNAHNTLIDVRDFMRREIELLNNIDDSRQMAAKEIYRDSFLANIQKIARSVDDSLDQLLSRKKALEGKRDTLAERLQALVDKQRQYNRMVSGFQAECLKNEELQKLLDGQS